MHYQEQNTYPKSTDVVLRMFTDQDFFLTKYRNISTQVELIECRHGSGMFSITASRQVTVEVPVPAFARHLVPNQLTIIQTDTWDLARRTGTLDIQLKGVPVSIKCDMALRDQGGQCVQDLHFTLKVGVPLIGGKLEKLLADDLRRKFAADAAEAHKALANYS